MRAPRALSRACIRAAVPETTSFRAGGEVSRTHLRRSYRALFASSVDGMGAVRMRVQCGASVLHMLFVGGRLSHNDGVGWVLFLKNKTGSTATATVTYAFRAFFAVIKPLINDRCCSRVCLGGGGSLRKE